jgi:hypothetical protein
VFDSVTEGSSLSVDLGVVLLGIDMNLSGPQVILILKILVCIVSVLFAASLIALVLGKKRLHGRINTVFFILTLSTVVGFELLLRLGMDVTSQFSEAAKSALRIHLGFAIPSAIALPAMFVSGWYHHKRLHVILGFIFLVLWTGTFITGVFYLPHE